jgi:hypothetical protein
VIVLVVIAWLVASLAFSVIAGRALRDSSDPAASQGVTPAPHAGPHLAQVVPIGSARARPRDGGCPR